MSELALRPAQAADCEHVFEWANDPTTRAASFQSARIDHEEHVRWFAASLKNPRRHLLMAELGGELVGLVRFDALDDATLEVGINLAPAARGRRLATPLLQAGAGFAAGLGANTIVAHIRPSNTASQRAFRRAGYREVERTTVSGQEALRYELRIAAVA